MKRFENRQKQDGGDYIDCDETFGELVGRLADAATAYKMAKDAAKGDGREASKAVTGHRQKVAQAITGMKILTEARAQILLLNYLQQAVRSGMVSIGALLELGNSAAFIEKAPRGQEDPYWRLRFEPSRRHRQVVVADKVTRLSGFEFRHPNLKEGFATFLKRFVQARIEAAVKAHRFGEATNLRRLIGDVEECFSDRELAELYPALEKTEDAKSSEESGENAAS